MSDASITKKAIAKGFKHILKNKNFEKITRKVLKGGLEFCFGLSSIAIIILLTYNFFFAYPIIYYIGLTLFRLSLIFGIEFIICGFITDGIKKQII